MPLDGVAVAGIVSECHKLIDGRIDKIIQPEDDEIIITVRAGGENRKLLLTSNPSHPRVHFTSCVKHNPEQAPMFCMVLRKHLSGGKIIDVTQPGFDRIIEIIISSPNEMGDRSIKKLIIEIMGKHSNIILINGDDVVVDSIKRVSHNVSSVREVLPGKNYVRPLQTGKISPVPLDRECFFNILKEKAGLLVQKTIYQSYYGISPVMASEICIRAGAAPEDNTGSISGLHEKIFENFFSLISNSAEHNNFTSRIYYTEDRGKKIPYDFSAEALSVYSHMEHESFDTVSEMLEKFYSVKDTAYRAGQKTSEMKKTVSMLIDRCIKKRGLYEQTLTEIENRDLYRIYGEYITAYIYEIKKGSDFFNAKNFTDGSDFTVPLDSGLTPVENAQAYFKKYSKEKRTFAALQNQISQNESDYEYLESVSASLLTVTEENEVSEIRAELYGQGYIKKPNSKKNRTEKISKPLHFVSTNGFDIYVGKNNSQNDILTMRTANGSDMWFHAKNIPGSHVIVKTNGADLPAATVYEAANLAAYYSKASGGSRVPVDYTLKKHVKKPNGAKPGYVIYEKNQTVYVTPEQTRPSPN